MGGISLEDNGSNSAGSDFARQLATAMQAATRGNAQRKTINRLKQQSMMQMFSEMQRGNQAATLNSAAEAIDSYVPAGNLATDFAYLQGAVASAFRTSAQGLGGIFGTSASNAFLPLMMFGGGGFFGSSDDE